MMRPCTRKEGGPSDLMNKSEALLSTAKRHSCSSSIRLLPPFCRRADRANQAASSSRATATTTTILRIPPSQPRAFPRSAVPGYYRRPSPRHALQVVIVLTPRRGAEEPEWAPAASPSCGPAN